MKFINLFCLIGLLLVSGCTSQKIQGFSVGGRSLDEHILLYLKDVDPVKDAYNDFRNDKYRFLYIDGEPISLRPGLDEFLKCYDGIKSLRGIHRLDAMMVPFMSFGRVESYMVSETYNDVLIYIEQYNSEMEMQILEAGLDICSLLCDFHKKVD